MIEKMISHYKIHEQLGGSSTGVICKAKGTRLKRFVILIVLAQILQ
jgi:hypothetical protein